MNKEGININRNQNCQITFKNGVTVSILIGAGSYSSSRDMEFDYKTLAYEANTKSNNAEIAAFSVDKGWITRELRPDADDGVIGYQSPEDILSFLNDAANYKV